MNKMDSECIIKKQKYCVYQLSETQRPYFWIDNILTGESRFKFYHRFPKDNVNISDIINKNVREYTKGNLVFTDSPDGFYSVGSIGSNEVVRLFRNEGDYTTSIDEDENAIIHFYSLSKNQRPLFYNRSVNQIAYLSLFNKQKLKGYVDQILKQSKTGKKEEAAIVYCDGMCGFAIGMGGYELFTNS